MSRLQVTLTRLPIDQLIYFFSSAATYAGPRPEVWRLLDKCHSVRNLGQYEGDLNVDERLVADLIAASRTVAAKLDTSLVTAAAQSKNRGVVCISDIALWTIAWSTTQGDPLHRRLQTDEPTSEVSVGKSRTGGRRDPHLDIPNTAAPTSGALMRVGVMTGGQVPQLHHALV